MPQQIHEQIRALYPDPRLHDFILHTDGSGHADGYGGSACLVESNSHRKRTLHLSAYSQTSTDRAEFEGLLNGLQSIVDMMQWSPAADYSALTQRPKKLSVAWFTDRESLALSVWRQADGTTVYQRKKQGDLWARFEYYEKIFHVIPYLIARNSTPSHEYVDRLASEARILIKEYMEILKTEKLNADLQSTSHGGLAPQG